jgi:asparagine synthase (glutamine-hydrolysing)
VWYVAFVWNAQSATECEASAILQKRLTERETKWHAVIRVAGLSVYTTCGTARSAERIYHLPHETGVLIGRLFTHAPNAETYPSPDRVSARSAAAILQSHGRALIRDYWGAYIAFIRDAHRSAVFVLRDPTGAIPCSVMHLSGIQVYFRRLQDCAAFAPFALSLNHRYLIARLAYWVACRRDSGLNEVSMVLASECIEHRGEKTTRQFYWNPLDVARTDIFDSFERASAETRRCVRACVHSWANHFESVLHNTSGGLDSTIVLACLASASSRIGVTCLCQFGRSLSSDERFYARLAARTLQYPLLELPAIVHWDFEPPLTAAPCPVPYPWLGMREQSALHAQIARRYGASALFSGHGGDELFFHTAGVPSSADFLYLHGFTPKWFTAIRNDVLVERRSFWNVTRAAGLYGSSRKRWGAREMYAGISQPLIPSPVMREALDDPDLLHPWFRESVDVPPAKLEQAFLIILHTARIMNPIIAADAPLEIAPLLSQPVMEVCLRTPTYLCRRSGRDRAVARHAFSTDLPAEIAQRRSKGMGDDTTRRALVAQRMQIRDYLLGGFLAQHRYVDCEGISRLLAGEPTQSAAHFNHLLDFLTIESWARYWAEHRWP